MTPEELKNLEAWKEVAGQSRDLDPVIREALRPVFVRLKAEAPHTAC